MTDTTFIPGTVVASTWLNDVNTMTYKSFVNVKMAPFNAVGDGVTDDTAAFQAAINYLLPTGGHISVPKGTYKITSSLSITAAVWTPILIKGDAYSVIDSSSFSGVLFSDASGNVRFEDLILNGPGKAVTTSWGISSALGLGWIKGCTIKNYYYGVDCSGSTSGLVERNRFSLNHVGVNSVKISPLFSNIISVVRNYLDFNDYGVYFDEVYGLVLDSNAFEFNATGAYFNNVRELDMRGNNWFEAQTSFAFQLLGSCTGQIATQTHIVTAAGNTYTISSTSIVEDNLTPQDVLLRRSTTQSIAHNTSTDVVWDVETSDPAGMHAASSANVTISRTGIYSVSTAIQLDAVVAPAAGVFVRATVKLNAATLREVSCQMNANQPTQLSLSFSERLGASDVLQVSVYQNSGSSVNILSGAVSSFSVVFTTAV